MPRRFFSYHSPDQALAERLKAVVDRLAQIHHGTAPQWTAVDEELAQISFSLGRFEVLYCFDVRFRTPRPVAADKLEEVFKAAPFKRPLRFYRPDGMNRHDGWLAVESCGYADFGEAEASGARLQEGLLIVAAKQKVGVELYLRGAVKAIHVYPGGQFELRDPGLPLPTPLTDHELKEMMGAAVESAASLTANQRVAAELLNDSFFKMSPEASFLLRVSAVEALCPQADQTDAFRTIVDSVLASIPKEAPSSDRYQIEQALKMLAARQSVRSAYTSKIKQLIGDDKAKKFGDLYDQRSKFLHEGSGRGTLGSAADTALEIGLELLLADIALSARATAGDGVEAMTGTDKDGATFSRCVDVGRTILRSRKARPFEVAILRDLVKAGGYQYGFKSGALMWLPPAVWPSWAWICNCISNVHNSHNAEFFAKSGCE